MDLVRDIPIPRLAYDFDIKNPTSSVKVSLEFFRPELQQHLKSHKLVVKSLSGGIVNQLFLVYLEKDEEIYGKTIIRINGAGSMIDRETEIRILTALNQHQFNAKLYGVFSNGICYDYLPGIILPLEKIRDDHITRLVIQKIAKIHSFHGHESLDKDVDIFQKMRRILNGIPDSYNDPARNTQFHQLFPHFRALFSGEINCLERHILEHSLQSLKVFSHNDLHYCNILYQEENDYVHFIDFEFAGTNYQAYDLANYFNEFAGFYECDYSLYPDPETQMPWLRYYLECWNIEHGQDDENIITDEQVDELFVLVNKFSLVSHLFWALWQLYLAQNSAIDFDYLRYAKDRFQEYNTRKEACIALNLYRLNNNVL